MQMEQQQQKHERSLGELFTDLADETRTLMQQEVELAKLELSHKISHTEKSVTSLALGGSIAYAGLLAFIATAIIGLSYAIPVWLSALIVSVVVSSIGAALIVQGRNKLKSENLLPKHTLATLKEDKRWAKRQLT
jgi:uncharacterized membrane protein YqjE